MTEVFKIESTVEIKQTVTQEFEEYLLILIQEEYIIVSRWSFCSIFKLCYNTKPSFFTLQIAAFERI
jgi:hypothetical protein